MSSVWQALGGKLGALTARWSAFTAVTSLVLYALGYLALRFQLTALGIGTDLAVLDERYLFEGAKFLVYAVLAVPIAVLAALLVAAVGWLIVRVFPSSRVHAQAWWSRRTEPLVVGVVCAVAMIQLVMRQCLRFDDLLLRDTLPAPDWFAAILLASDDAPAQLYFTSLLVGIAVPAWLASALGPWAAATAAQRVFGSVLVALLVIEVSLLPVNYGILAGARRMPRVRATPDTEVTGSTAWMVWEGKTGVTYLVRSPAGARLLLTVPQSAVRQVQIESYDPLLRVVHCPAPSSSERCGRDHGVSGDTGVTSDSQTAALRVSPPPSSVAGASLGHRLAQVFGISASPSQQRPIGRGSAQGDLWVVSSTGEHARRITTGGTFHSPIFLPEGNAMLALIGARLVRITLNGGAVQELTTLPEVVKLIGFAEDPDKLLLLARQGGHPILRELRLGSWTLTTVPTDPQSAQDEAFLAYAEGEERQYGQVRLFVDEQSDPFTQWSDVFLQQGGQTRVNLTHGIGTSSREPTLSHDGKLVAYVRTRT